jgi:C-terminal processing protease CtpA/Prc
VRVLSLANKHDVLEVNDRIIEVNGSAVTGLSVREVADCVRRRRQDRILSLVVEKPRKWSIGRFFMRSEQRQEESLQRHVFGGSYPRTLHLTVIGAIGLPSLYPSAQYPNAYVEVTNRSTATSYRTTVTN